MTLNSLRSIIHFCHLSFILPYNLDGRTFSLKRFPYTLVKKNPLQIIFFFVGRIFLIEIKHSLTILNIFNKQDSKNVSNKFYAEYAY